MRLTNDPPVVLDGEEAARVALTVRHPLNEIEAAAAWNRLLAHIDAQADRIRDLEDELGAMTVAVRTAGCDLERQADRITQLEGEAAALRDWIADADHQPGCSGRVRPDLCKCGLLEIRPAASLDGKDKA